jgi:UDP-N-acetylglucosamine--N-acetylmuramyl-(pentapeptide) pyrophosphoryl-undecaprenol N-acetylglucosamine transferase
LSILFYAVDTVGLGHLSRTLGVAEAVRKIAPDMPILFVTEATEAQLLEEYPFPYYQVPSYDGLFSNKRWLQMPSQHNMDAWKGMLSAIVAAHRPSLVVHDTFLQRPLHKLARQHGAQEVLILRQRIDMAGYLHCNRHMLADFALIAIALYPEQTEKLDFPWLPASKLIYCGPLLRRTRGDLDLERIRRLYGLSPDEFTIVISNGGGNALPELDDDFLEVTLDALKTVEHDLPPYRAVVVTGPLSRRRIPWVDLERGKLVIREFEPYLFDLFAAANLVIARGGSSVMELQELGVPAICVPARRSTESQEQRIRDATIVASNIQLAALEKGELARVLCQVAVQPCWQYGPGETPDRMATNKERLARRLAEIVTRVRSALVA